MADRAIVILSDIWKIGAKAMYKHAWLVRSAYEGAL